MPDLYIDSEIFSVMVKLPARKKQKTKEAFAPPWMALIHGAVRSVQGPKGRNVRMGKGYQKRLAARTGTLDSTRVSRGVKSLLEAGCLVVVDDNSLRATLPNGDGTLRDCYAHVEEAMKEPGANAVYLVNDAPAHDPAHDPAQHPNPSDSANNAPAHCEDAPAQDGHLIDPARGEFFNESLNEGSGGSESSARTREAGRPKTTTTTGFDEGLFERLCQTPIPLKPIDKPLHSQIDRTAEYLIDAEAEHASRLAPRYADAVAEVVSTFWERDVTPIERGILESLAAQYPPVWLAAGIVATAAKRSTGTQPQHIAAFIKPWLDKLPPVPPPRPPTNSEPRGGASNNPTCNNGTRRLARADVALWLARLDPDALGDLEARAGERVRAGGVTPQETPAIFKIEVHEAMVRLFREDNPELTGPPPPLDEEAVSELETQLADDPALAAPPPMPEPAGEVPG